MRFRNTCAVNLKNWLAWPGICFRRAALYYDGFFTVAAVDLPPLCRNALRPHPPLPMKASFAALAALSFGTLIAQGAVSYTTSGQVVGTDFNSLASSGSSAAWTNDSTVSGWSLFNFSGGALATIAVGNGGGNAGSFYSFGSTGSSDRALGGLGSGGTYYGSPANGTTAGYLAVAHTNDTGGVLTAVTLSYDGEQWRNGGNATAHTYVLEYGFGATFAAVPAWTAAGAGLNFTGPIASTTAAAVDGNVAGFVPEIRGTISSLTWNPGDTFWLRWIEVNEAGNDHGLAIDNFSFSAVPEPSAAVTALSLLAGMLVRRRR